MRQTILLKWIILLSVLITDLRLKAQSYYPMPVSDAQWDITRCWSFYPGGWHDEYSVRLDGSDTTMNGRVYKKLNLVTHHLPGTQYDSIFTHFLGGMRETNKQVFFVSEYLCIDTIERMLYDFNTVENGDTIFTQVLTNGLTQFIPHIVTSIDSVLIGDDHHRRINLRDENDFFSESWIEGVGSSLGLVYPSYWLLTDNSYDLNCFYNQNLLKFTNPDPAYAFCTPPLPDIHCDPLNNSIPPILNVHRFNIYPNPAVDILNIETTSAFRSIHIVNGWGERIMTSVFTDQLEVHSLLPGFYFIEFTGNSDRLLATLKLIKM